jgi:hypothetical protein
VGFVTLALAIVVGASIGSASVAGPKLSGELDNGDPRDDLSPWGVASGTEWFSAFPVFNPVLKEAGAKWLRGFYEWQAIQPRQGYWNWALSDRLVDNARANHLHLSGVFAYLAPWASADGGTRKFPMKDIQFWRDYVGGSVARYHNDIKYWEVWNEFNGSFAENGTPEIYAELVKEASISAKKADPTAKIGLSVANFDVGFLETVIKAGAGGYFDFICVHPYEKLEALADDGEIDFLNMSTTLRQMLEANHQPGDTPLWITEIGAQTATTPDQSADRRQAMLLAKAYLLSIASGFQRVFWFEARGPSYGTKTDYGLIRADFTPRPSYRTLKTMNDALGPQPAPAGWLNINGSYGFLFQTERGYVLATWAPTHQVIKTTWSGDIRVLDLEGNQVAVAAGQELTLSDVPQFILDVPGALVDEAKANRSKPYPWSGDYARARTASVVLQDNNIDDGIRQINLDTTSVDGPADHSWRRTQFARPGGEGHYVYFATNPRFVSFGSKRLEITARVRRVATDKVAGMSLNYESRKGYVNGDYRNIPAGEQWQELTWRIEDANFVGQWGWNFRLNAISSPNEFLIKEVRVKKLD